MFMQRLITTLILVPLVLFILFYAPAWFLATVVLVVLFIAVTESWKLIPLNSPLAQWAFPILIAAGLWCCGHVFTYWLASGLILWIAICLAVITFPKSQQYWGYPGVVAAVCFLLFPLFGQGLIHLYCLPQGKALLLYLLFLIWAADIGAYLAGKQFGRHKLIPQVSPGKSWEGVLGGFALALLVACIAFFYFKPHSLAYWLLLAAVTAIISVFGDLFISILKRRCHLKDTGSIIPGHGGILDRLDSLIAALPVFYFGLTYIPL